MGRTGTANQRRKREGVTAQKDRAAATRALSHAFFCCYSERFPEVRHQTGAADYNFSGRMYQIRTYVLSVTRVAGGAVRRIRVRRKRFCGTRLPAGRDFRVRSCCRGQGWGTAQQQAWLRLALKKVLSGHPMLYRAVCRMPPAMLSSGITLSTPFSLIASFGIPKTMQVASS